MKSSKCCRNLEANEAASDAFHSLVKVTPLTRDRANEVIEQWHRHNKPVVGCRFAIGAEHDGQLVGVAVVGRPVARAFDCSKVAEVTRLCVVDGAPKNTCSFLYAACRRIWQSMGGERVITYTLASESGASLRAAGWAPTILPKRHGKGWLSRDREHQAVFDAAKLRWEAPLLVVGQVAPSDSTAHTGAK